MAFMDFLKKKEPTLSAPPPLDFNASPLAPQAQSRLDTPTEYVQNMQAQGLSNNQVIQILQQQGYQPTQIYDALSQASLRGSIAGAPPMPSQDIQQNFQIPQNQQSVAFPSIQAGPPPTAQAPIQMPRQSAGSPSFEEVAESIVDEKWKEIQVRLDKDKEWRDQTETRLIKLEQHVADLHSDVDNLHKAIVAKIGDYDKNLLNVGTEIRAMEKVFQKILPTLTDNVSELARITKTMKSPVLKK